MRKMYFLLLLDEVICRCHLYKLMNGVVEFTCVLTDFCLLDLSVSDRGVLKTPSVLVDSSISPFRLSVFASHTLNALLLGAYTLRILCLLE